MKQEALPLAVTMTEAARLAGVGKSYFYQELRRGNIDLPLIHLGRKTLVRVADLETWLAQQVGR